MHPNAKKAIPMSRKQIRMAIAKLDRTATRKESNEPCGLSFNQLMESLNND